MSDLDGLLAELNADIERSRKEHRDFLDKKLNPKTTSVDALAIISNRITATLGMIDYEQTGNTDSDPFIPELGLNLREASQSYGAAVNYYSAIYRGI